MLIGNTAYRGDRNASTVEWSRLDNAAKDAQDIGDELKKLGFRGGDVEVLQNLGRRNMLVALARFKERAKKADQVVFYFSGHGLQDESQNYLIPVDSPDKRRMTLIADTVTLKEVLDAVSVGPGQKVVMLDACRTPPGSKGDGGGLANPEKEKPLPPGVTVVFAAAAGQSAMDGESGGNGFFAQGLIEGLRQNDTSLRNVIDVAEEKVERLSSGSQVVTMYGASRAQKNFAFAPARSSYQGFDATASKPAQTLGASLREEPKDTQSLFGESKSTPPTNTPPNLFSSLFNKLAAVLTPPAGQTGSLPKEPVLDCEVCPEMVKLPAGSFVRGAAESERAPYLTAWGDATVFNRSLPQKVVRLKAFGIGKTEVTQSQYQAVMGYNPSDAKECGPDCPVENVTWMEVQRYIDTLNTLTKNRFGYRLPSEAEWEYAARGLTQTPYYTGSSVSTQQANFANKVVTSNNEVCAPEGKPKTVGNYNANAFGVFDTLGNVAEWVQDCAQDNYSIAPIDGTAYAPANSARSCWRVVRGGGWRDFSDNIRSASRDFMPPDIYRNDVGFRVARSLL